MNDPRYQYVKVNAIKVIIQRSDGKILLIQEPETNDWMPGHWGLPGGKPLQKESLYEAFKRKMKEELGKDIEPMGIYKIEELLIEEKTVLMFHVVAELGADEDIKGESQNYKWVDINEIESMDTAEFTEYFNKKLLLKYLKGKKQVISFDLIETWNYHDLSNDKDYKRWLESDKR